jgi:predicted lipoprotein with Yx(FWY)xxD motif
MRRGESSGITVRRFGWRGVVSAATGALALTALSVRAPATATAVAPPPGAVVISSGGSGAIGAGRVLVDGDGFSLYDFTGDGFEALTGCQLASNVSPTGASCTSVWTPVLATGPLVATNAAQLGTEDRPGIGTQVTYAGEPLYRFVRDTAPGQTSGQDVTAFRGVFRLVSVHGGPAADRASVGLQLTADGTVLNTPTAANTRPVYVLSADPKDMTSCTNECAAIWPPVLTNHAPAAGPGVDPSGLGVLHRPDGTLQATYFGKPVYMFAFDLAAGSPSSTSNGDNFIDPPALGVWDTLGPSGVPVTGPITVTTETVGGSTILAAVGNPFPGGAATATLYSFSNDTGTSSACNGACADAWPPLLTSETPIAGPGVDAGKLGTVQRADGSFQITYAGHPLYMFSHALNATTNGDGIMAFGGQFHTSPPESEQPVHDSGG